MKVKTNEKLPHAWVVSSKDKGRRKIYNDNKIYLQNGDDLISVAKIKATNHTKKKVVRDKLFKLEVEIELGYDNYRQRF